MNFVRLHNKPALDMAYSSMKADKRNGQPETGVNRVVVYKQDHDPEAPG